MNTLRVMRGSSFLTKVGLLGVLALGFSKVQAWSPTNLSSPLESTSWTTHLDLLPDHYEKSDPKEFRIKTGVSLEYAFDGEGRNANDEVVDIYQIWDSSQNAFVFDASSPTPTIAALGSLALIASVNNFGPDANVDSPVRLIPTARRDQTDITFWGRLALPIDSVPGQIEASVFVPVRFLNLDSFAWSFDTAAAISGGQPVGALSTSNLSSLEAIIKDSTHGLDIKDFDQTHIGDVHAMISWRNHYSQVNESLSNISLFFQSGVLIPTSVTRDVDKALAIPLGNDNALAVPFGGAVNLHFMDNFRLGASADFLVSFGEDSTRRVRNSQFESELIIPRTFSVHRDPGVLIKLMGLAEITSPCKKFFGGVAYQFAYRNEDKLSSNDSGFNSTVANDSESLKEKNYHNVIVRGGFDFSDAIGSEYAPRLSLAYKHPIKGKRVAVYKTFTVEASISF